MNIIITGASKGIGKAVADRYAKQGNKVLMLARNEELLNAHQERLGKEGLETFIKKCDVSIKNDVINAVEYARKKFKTIDIAVLNAGVGGNHWFEEPDSMLFHKIYGVNIFGVVYFIEALVPIMKAQGYGKIAGVGSLAEARGFPGSAVYCSSKTALSHILEGARIELKSTGIEIITIKPGWVDTDMIKKNNFFMPFVQNADRAARKITNGIAQGKKRISFPWPIVILSNLARITPNFIYEAIAGSKPGTMINRRPKDA